MDIRKHRVSGGESDAVAAADAADAMALAMAALYVRRNDGETHPFRRRVFHVSVRHPGPRSHVRFLPANWAKGVSSVHLHMYV